MDRHTNAARINVAIDLLHAVLNDLEKALHQHTPEDPMPYATYKGLDQTHTVAADAMFDLLRVKVALSRDTIAPDPKFDY